MNPQDMKLELRHLAPYLPYELKFLYNGQILPLVALNFEFECQIDLHAKNCLIDVRLSESLPLLIPLHQSENFGLLYSIINSEISTIPDYLGSLESLQKFIKGRFPNGFQYLDYRFVEDMFKNHIDVFNLIDNNFALNKLDYEQ